MEIRTEAEARNLSGPAGDRGLLRVRMAPALTPERLAALAHRFTDRLEDRELTAFLALNVLGWAVGSGGAYLDSAGNPTGYCQYVRGIRDMTRRRIFAPLFHEGHLALADQVLFTAGRFGDYAAVLAAYTGINVSGGRWGKLKNATMRQRAMGFYFLLLDLGAKE